MLPLFVKQTIYIDPYPCYNITIINIMECIVVTLPVQYAKQVKARDDAKETRFVQLNRGPVTSDPMYSKEPPMAFDHDKIVADYINKVRR